MSMPLGIFAKTFQRDSVLEVLKNVKKHKFSVTHFNFTCVGLSSMPDFIPANVLASINAAKKQTNIDIIGVSGTFNMAHPNQKVIEDGLKNLSVIAAVCPTINTKLITLCTGSRNVHNKWAFHPENSSKLAWKVMLKSMESAIEIAEKHNLYLGIEPELANIVNTPIKAKHLIKELQSNRIKIILDPANLFEEENIRQIRYLILEAIDLLAPHICMAHAKDRSANGIFVAPGKGVIPFDFFIQELKNSGVNCPLVAHGFLEAETAFVSDYLALLAKQIDYQSKKKNI